MSQELIEQHIQEAETFSIQSSADLENFRLKYLSKKGVLADLFALMKNIEPAERKNYGLQVNLLKQKTEAIFESFKEKFENVTTEEKKILPCPVSQ